MRTILGNILVLILLISCNSITNETRKIANESLKEYPELKDIPLDFQLNDLYLINLENSYFSKSQLCKSKYMIINYINTDCGNCIVQIGEWSNIIKKYSKIFKKVPVVFIAEGQANNYFEHWVKREKNITPVYYDPDNLVPSSLFYFALRKEGTMLVETELGPLILGSPLKNPEILKSYIELIDNITRDDE